MALSFPLSTPSTIGIESIEIRAMNSVATSQSPFTYKQQIVSHGGQRWEASVNIPTVRRDLAADWKAFLTALKGQTGTFLLGDPDYSSPRGDVSSYLGPDTDAILTESGDFLLSESGGKILLDRAISISGNEGDESVTVVMDGTLKAGDYIQIGSGSSARLHQVLQDQTGDGTLEIWPGLRSDYSPTSIIFNNPKGVFRLKENMNSWNINSASAYSISFEAVEAIT